MPEEKEDIMRPKEDKMNVSASSQSDDVFLENNQNTAPQNYNPINVATTPRLPTAVSYDSLKPKHFHHPGYFSEEEEEVTKKPQHPHANINPESGVDHSSLLEEIPANTAEYTAPPDADKSSWYSRWEEKESLDKIEEEERRKEEKRRKSEHELRKLRCGLGKMFLKEEKEEEIRIIKSSLDPRIASRSPNANLNIHRKMRYSTPAASSPSRVLKEARKSVPEYVPLDNNDNPPPITTKTITKASTSEFSTNPPGSDGASSRGSSDSGSNLALHESHCSANMVQSMPDISGYHKILPYQVLKTTNARRPLGVDKSSLEKHLHPQEFFQVFSMTQEQFYRLPRWRQLEIKKKVHLF